MIQPQYAQAYPQPATGASAVTINIVEPKAYGSPQQEMMMPNYTNPMYNYPQASAYAQNPMQMAPYYQQYAYQPQMPYASPMMPQYQQPEAPQVAAVPQQDMPAPVIQPGQQMQPQVQETQLQPEAGQNTQQTQTTAPVQVEPPKPTEQVDVNALVQGLRSTDPALQEEAITKVANLSQAAPEIAQQVLNDQVMQALADILKDTPAAPETTQPQQPTFTGGLFKKKNKKAEEAEQPAQTQQPDVAQNTQQAQPAAPVEINPQDKNKILASFTIAILNDMFRNEYDKFKTQQGPEAQVRDLQIAELPGFNELSGMVQTAQNPELKLAAIQSISYVARPQDKATVEGVLQLALNDQEPLIQQTAREAIDKLNGVQPQQAAPQTQAA